jgi:hypothetical protein
LNGLSISPAALWFASPYDTCILLLIDQDALGREQELVRGSLLLV